MSDIMEFASREEFRQWLSDHCLSNAGIWLLFGKAGGPKTIKAGEALEEALCFGWIDGQMKSIDDKTYKKYFSSRRENSKWSEKNKALVKRLGQEENRGRQKERTMGYPQIPGGDRGTDSPFIWFTKSVRARL